MSNLGQQLQEARSRSGQSLKDVSDIIHIRAEYLGEIEENTFSIPLPTVYIRGFVRLYAKFLKLDADAMVELFNKRNQQLEFSSEVTADREKLRTGKSLGQITLPGAKEQEMSIEKANRVNIFDRYKPSDDEPHSPWVYVAGIGTVVILVFAAIFAVKITFFPTIEQPPTATAATETNQSETASSHSNNSVSVESLKEELIGLVAKAPIYIYVTQTKDKEILFSGRLESGERKTLIREGEIAIACDKAENLIVEKGGLPIDLKGATGKVQFLVD